MRNRAAGSRCTVVLRWWSDRRISTKLTALVVAALLGFAVLGRRLYRMRRQSKAVGRVRLVLDEKVMPFEPLSLQVSCF